MRDRAALFALLVVGGALWLYSRPSRAAAVAAPDGEPAGFDIVWEIDELFGGAVSELTAARRLSAAGLQAIRVRESFSSTWYPDGQGWSIGYGHWSSTRDPALEPCSRELGEAMLATDVLTAEGAVDRAVSVELTQSQFDALVSFAYNVGASAFAGSTLVRVLNAGDFGAVGPQMDRWIKETKNGVKVVNAGLVNRRKSEKDQFYAA
jgi:lysozyme